MVNGYELSDDNLHNPITMFEKVIEAIYESPISDKVKKQAETTLLPQRVNIDSFNNTPLYAAPERDAELDITFYVLDIIEPTFTQNGVPLPDGRNTIRNIYKKIGGKQEAIFD